MTKNVLTPVHLNGEWLLVRAPRTRIGASHVYVPTNTPPKYRRALIARKRDSRPTPATPSSMRALLRSVSATGRRFMRGNRKAA